jgi:hypothetical protein
MLFFLQLPFWLRSVWVVLLVVLPLIAALVHERSLLLPMLLLVVLVQLADPALAAALC